MASGFITLPNGENWSARWSRYDYILRTIMLELHGPGDERYLKDWLQLILPNESDGDIECGWGFHKKDLDFDLIVRILDTRLMSKTYYDIFWKTVELLSLKLNVSEDIGYLINELYCQFQQNQKANIEEIAITEEDADNIFSLGGFIIGK